MAYVKSMTQIIKTVKCNITKLNGKILGTNRYPQLNGKLQSAIGEWQGSLNLLIYLDAPIVVMIVIM